MKEADKAWLGILLIACAAAMVWCGGCASTPMGTARTVVSISAQTVVAIDHAVSPGFVGASATQDADPDKFRRYNGVVVSLLLARMAILDAEVALDAIDAGRDGEIGDVIACVVEAVQNLIALLPTLDVHIPDAVAMVMSMASAFNGTCGADHEIDVSSLPAMSEAITVVGAQ